MAGPALAKDRLPDFIIAGTQKGGTTWLEHNLNRHPQVCTPRRQLHFFDREWDRGLDWYREQFASCSRAPVIGEKTTEYLDTLHCDRTAQRIATTLPDVKLIFMLRDPVDRAISAVRHHVNSGLEKVPRDLDRLLHGDADLGEGKGFRYLERGLYAQQIATFLHHIPAQNMLSIVLEEDVKRTPERTWSRVSEYLGLDPLPALALDRKVNVLRLSRPALDASRLLYSVPYARAVIRRADRVAPLKKWSLEVPGGLRERLQEYYREDIAKLETLLDRDLTVWKTDPA